MSQADTAIRAAAGVTVVALAGIAGAISYSHLTGLADAHGEQGWRTHAFPLSVDGVEVVASLVLLADRRAGRRSRLLPWAALVAGTAASFAANVAVGGSDWIGRAVADWPAFALLTAVKLLFGLSDHPLQGVAGNALPVPVAPDADRPPAARGDRPDSARCRPGRGRQPGRHGRAGDRPARRGRRRRPGWQRRPGWRVRRS